MKKLQSFVPAGRARPSRRLPLLLLLLLALLPAAAPSREARAAGTAISGLHVGGKSLLNGANQPVRLRGVNRSGTEYACIQGWGFFDGPSDAASVQAMAAWRANAVRVPLNEHCWLGVNGAAPEYSGANYRRTISDYVNLLNRYGLVAILELHWSAAGARKATGQDPMPNRDHSIAFWQQVAAQYKGNDSVILDLFNEPYPENNSDTVQAWECWKLGYSGGVNYCPSLDYQAAGMQELVTAVRDTGARNVIMLGGVQYSHSLSRWLAYKPYDPANNLVAAWHVYNFNTCTDAACWDARIAPVARTAPVVAGEIGEDDWSDQFIRGLLPWLESHGVGYLAWVWDTWDGYSIALISGYDGTPTTWYGQAYRDYLASIRDTVAPVATAPTQGFPVGAQLGAADVPAKLTWSATDDSSGIVRYRLQQQSGAAAYADVPLPSATSAGIIRMLTPGQTYRFRVQAMDRAGNWSQWTYGRSFVPGAYREISTSITYTGAWTRQALSGAYGGYVKYAAAPGASARFAFTGCGVSWVAQTGADRGQAQVYVDGVLARTVDLYSTAARPRAVVFARAWGAPAPHTVELRVLGTSGRPRVDLDALLTLERCG